MPARSPYYQQVLAADKDSAAAHAGLKKIHKSLLQQAGDALDRGDERDAARVIDELAQVPETDEDVSGLQSRLKTLRQVMPLLTRAADLLQKAMPRRRRTATHWRCIGRCSSSIAATSWPNRA